MGFFAGPLTVTDFGVLQRRLKWPFAKDRSACWNRLATERRLERLLLLVAMENFRVQTVERADPLLDRSRAVRHSTSKHFTKPGILPKDLQMQKPIA